MYSVSLGQKKGLGRFRLNYPKYSFMADRKQRQEIRARNTTLYHIKHNVASCIDVHVHIYVL